MSKVDEREEVDFPELIEPEVREILERKEEFENEGAMMIGIESEYGVLNVKEPAQKEDRNAAIEDIEFADSELGAAMAETRTHPMEIDNLDELAVAIGARENILMDSMEELGLSLIRYGTIPFQSTDEIELSRPGEEELDEDEVHRYQQLVNAFDELREEHKGELEPFGEKEKIDPNTAAIPASITSTQVNITGEDAEDTVEKANYAQMVLPEAIALSGASRLMSGKDTGYSDIRMWLWEDNYNTPETPNKVGPMQEGFLEDIEDRFSRLSIFADEEFDHPQDYEEEEGELSPLQTAIKEDWKDVKIKVTDDSEWDYLGEGGEGSDNNYFVLEIRPFSQQPSVAEEVALHGYMIGRIAYAQEHGEDLSIEETLANRELAMDSGVNAEGMF